MNSFEAWWAKNWSKFTELPIYQSQMAEQIWNAAYRAGMLQAAEIAEDVEEGCGYGCPNIIVDAIRKEAVDDQRTSPSNY